MFLLKPTEPHPLVEVARTQLGYRAQPNRNSAFGRAARYNGTSWDGSFVDAMLHEAGLRETSTVSTVNALQYYINRGRLREVRPKVGDLVFYGFSANGLYPNEQPHIGIVTDISHWKTDLTFRAIEGETATGSAKGSQEVDGVFERIRSKADVIGFVTPKRPKLRTEVVETASLPKLRASYFASNPKTRSKAVQVLQVALSQQTDRVGFTNGVWDPYTQSTLDEFRRQNGLLGKTGPPDEIDLRLLHRQTGGTVFNLET